MQEMSDFSASLITACEIGECSFSVVGELCQFPQYVVVSALYGLLERLEIGVTLYKPNVLRSCGLNSFLLCSHRLSGNKY